MRKFEDVKKIELNCRLDGSLDITLASEWSKIPINELKKRLTKYRGIQNLSDYLEKFELPISLLQTKEHLIEATYTLCENMLKENVCYAEVRVAPFLHTQKSLTLDEVIVSVLVGLHKSKLKSNLILTMKREDSIEVNKQVIDYAKKYILKGVCAVDLVGDEGLFPTDTFRELFDYAKEVGVPFVIGAGENGSFKDIDVALKFGAKRISYGVLAIKNYKTMEYLKHIKVPLEICFSSNIDTGSVASYDTHPISRLIDSGVLVTINTDNRTLSKTDLSHEYYLLNKYFGFDREDFRKMNIISIKNAFLSEEEKKELLKLFEV